MRDEDANSTAANRFALTGDLALAPDQSQILRYDAKGVIDLKLKEPVLVDTYDPNDKDPAWGPGEVFEYDSPLGVNYFWRADDGLMSRSATDEPDMRMPCASIDDAIRLISEDEKRRVLAVLA